MKIDQRYQGIWTGYEIQGVNPLTLTCDIEVESR